MVFTTEGFVELAIESWSSVTLYIAEGQNVNKKPTIANEIFYYFLPL